MRLSKRVFGTNSEKERAILKPLREQPTRKDILLAILFIFVSLIFQCRGESCHFYRIHAQPNEKQTLTNKSLHL